MSEGAITPPDAQALLTQLAGKQVAALQIYGVNSLKTLDPSLADLTEDVIVGVQPGGDGRCLDLILDRHVVEVDLARTGVAVFLPSAQPWTPSGRSQPPTGRLILTDGSGVDFKEPARTKRITFSVRRRESSS